MKQRTESDGLFYGVLFLIGLGGCLAVLYSTVWGSGWMSDSFQYVSSASSFARGLGLNYVTGSGKLIPLTHYPPMYSVILSLLNVGGVDIIAGARYLNAILLGANAFLVGISIRMATGSTGYAWVGAAIVAISAPVVEVHSWLLSEPAYLFLSILSMIVLGIYMHAANQRAGGEISWWAFSLGAILAGLALLTRLVGIALVATGLIALILMLKTSWGKKIRIGLAWIVISLAPIGYWTFQSNFKSGTLIDRSFEWVRLTSKNLGLLFNTIATWWLPPAVVNSRERLLAIGVLVFLLGGLLVVRFKWFDSLRGMIRTAWQTFSTMHPLFQLNGIYILMYLAVVLGAKSIFESGMGMSDRMLLPLYPASVILLMGFFAYLNHRAVQGARIVTTLICAYLLLFNAFLTVQAVGEFHEIGLGVAKRRWHESSAIQIMREAEGIPIYSNSPSIVYRWTQSGSYSIKNFDPQDEDDLRAGALVVVFNYIPPSDRTVRIIQELRLLESDNVASIYLYQP